jgi:hypothetical protein
VRVDRDDAADRQAPRQAGPGAGVYAGRRDEGLRSARPVSDACGGLVRGMRCEAPIWRRIALDWRGDSAVASPDFIVEGALSNAGNGSPIGTNSDAGNGNTP